MDELLEINRFLKYLCKFEQIYSVYRPYEARLSLEKCSLGSSLVDCISIHHVDTRDYINIIWEPSIPNVLKYWCSRTHHHGSDYDKVSGEVEIGETEHIIIYDFIKMLCMDKAKKHRKEIKKRRKEQKIEEFLQSELEKFD